MKKQRDEEEAAALVPPPPSHQDRKDDRQHEDQKQQHQMDDDPHTRTTTELESSSGGEGERLRRQLQLVPVWWRRRAQKLLVPTRGVGLAIAGLLVLALLVGGGGTSSWRMHLDYASSFLLGGRAKQHQQWPLHHVPSPEAELVPVPPLSCGNGSRGWAFLSATSCPRRSPWTSSSASPSPSPSVAPVASSSKSKSKTKQPPPPECPEYFRYIHSDLSPWRETGISRETVERGRGLAAFRLVVVGGRAYVESYHRVFQTRDSFTLWGIAQLLARYPGRIPDLDLMFNCEDMPTVKKPPPSEALLPPPPLFRYCKDASTVDMVFPDWSFWGWPEVNIRPWAPLLEEMDGEMARLPWEDRQPYAYWKGNPGVSGERRDLLRCNDTSTWSTQVFWQDWTAAIRDGFRGSNLAEQCRYRYKIFVRGRSWSVSEKYILACDSPVLLVDTPFQDFFSRGLVAGRHYWPIDPGAGKCAGIKFAVEWGNAHPEQARRMAEQGSGFARHHLSMDYVYDYMLHLLTEYAGLLRYKPTVPEHAVELCAEAVACSAGRDNRELDFMMQSRERFVADFQPCTLPPPFTDEELSDMARRDKEVRDNIHRMMTAADAATSTP